MKKIYSLGFVLMVLFAMTMSATALEKQTGNPNPGVLPPHSKPYGSTYGELSVKWWHWVLSMPVEKNPIFDTANCAEGQSGNVWFLGGTFGGPEITRECTVPAGKSIFFPIINVAWIATEPGETEEMMRAQAKAFIDETILLEVSIDGVPLQKLQNYRTDSPAFDVDLLFGDPVEYGPAVSDGFWLMLAPLSAGSHEISIHGIVGDPLGVEDTFEVKVTYYLVVASRNT